MNVPTAEVESITRLVCFVGVIVLMTIWELVSPRRPYTASRVPRWLSNMGLVAINVALTRMLLPLTAFGTATLSAERGWGVLNHWPAPYWGRFAVAFAILDFAIYIQHVVFHAIPALWRVHRVHHADLDFDVTTGLRFHTAEIILSSFIKIGVVFALGPPVWAVVAFEVILNASSMFNHGNVQIPASLDKLLRLFIVTPEMHRVHHSIDVQETNTNFGFNLPWWDYLLGTYCAQPAAGHENMTIGVPQFRNERQVDRLPGMLTLPFMQSCSTRGQ